METYEEGGEFEADEGTWRTAGVGNTINLPRDGYIPGTIDYTPYEEVICSELK